MTAGAQIAHVVGARPNFMKAAPVVRAIQRRGINQRLLHTGQHYDAALSRVFFDELGLPRPDVNLEVGSGTHAVQTARIMTGLDQLFDEARYGLVVVYGDVNSTIAAALVAAKRHIPVAHVEAGLRSFDDTMPEEINRRVTDVLSEILYVTAPEGLENLRREGAPDERVRFVGNPMIDTLLANLPRFDARVAMERHGLSGRYALATIHRPSNVDDPIAAASIVEMLRRLSDLLPVLLPLHPRGAATLHAAGLGSLHRIRVVEPLGYIEFMSLVRGASMVITDSGGIQEETTVLGIPCLTVRPNTERPITISHGTNRLVEPAEVPGIAEHLLAGGFEPPRDRPPLWDGNAGERIAADLERWIGRA